MYVFRRLGGVWSQIGILEAPTQSPTLIYGIRFGMSVAFASDSTIVVGAPYAVRSMANDGRVYMYRFAPEDILWCDEFSSQALPE